jgi:hypothetical protein
MEASASWTGLESAMVEITCPTLLYSYRKSKNSESGVGRG